MSSLRQDLLLLDAMLDKILSLLFQMIQTWTYYYILWWENDPLLDLLNWIIDVRSLLHAAAAPYAETGSL